MSRAWDGSDRGVQMTNDEIINYVLKNEGGYTDNSHDHGGPTNFGITAADLGEWMGRNGPASAPEVRAMSEVTARAIYAKKYIAQPHFDRIANDALRLVAVDSGVLFGTRRATEWLQAVVGAAVDGDFGDETTAKIAVYAQPNLLARKVLGKRFAAIAGIVSNDRSQAEFLAGWINRAVGLLDFV